MRTLIISDVHANLTALKAVLDDAKPFDRVWCLGDVVGYGPDPNECINRIRDLPGLKCVKGNHDAAILGDININAFNYEARVSLRWLETVLDPDNKRWLQSLGEKIVLGDMTLVHGSPSSPIWEYVMDLRTARENMIAFNTSICLVGHTHIPAIYEQNAVTDKTTRMHVLEIGKSMTLDNKCIVNPGSVGQPRDHDPRASYLIYEDIENEWVFHRVPYDVEQVQNRIIEAGLPARHANRLRQGW